MSGAWWDSILVIVLILTYGFALAKYIPERFHFAANIAASLMAILFGLKNGINLEAMGLSLHFIIKGIVVAALCSAGIMIAAGLVTLFAPIKRLVALPSISRPGKITYETAVRIPLSTALSEEILFRGVLLAVLMQQSSTLIAVIICSVVFGLWHALPTIRDHASIAVIPIIFATAAAGIFFCWLRLLAGSIVAPWLIHWTINASALLAVHFIRKKVHDIT